MRQIDISEVLSKLSAKDAAARLLGCDLIRFIDGHKLVGRIVETEAYDEFDVASHSFRGITKRNQVMFGPAGKAYVYFTYGMHYCLNVVVGEESQGSAVLIRAMEPLAGIEIMMVNRHTDNLMSLLSGPAKLCQALSIDKSFNGHDLTKPPLLIYMNDQIEEENINWSKRIGIRESKDKELLWRACIKRSKYLSRPL